MNTKSAFSETEKPALDKESSGVVVHRPCSPPWWKHVWRGCGYLDIAGNHPGTPMLVIMILAGAAATGWHGGLMMSLLFGPLYLIGAHGRSVYDWRHSENAPAMPTASDGRPFI